MAFTLVLAFPIPLQPTIKLLCKYVGEGRGRSWTKGQECAHIRATSR